MNKTRPGETRIEELAAMLAAYRQMTVEEIEEGGWGDVRTEIEDELWRLEQELFDRRRVSSFH